MARGASPLSNFLFAHVCVKAGYGSGNSESWEVHLVPLRILLVDDHDVMRGGLRSLLESRPGWEVCGEAVNSADAVEKARALRPDVVVLDISMPGSSGLEAVPLIRKDTPSAEVLILSRYEEREMRLKALEAGARAYVAKTQGLARELLSAIDGIVRERTAF